MNGERTAKNPRFVPEALWLLDWRGMGSLLDEAAIEKLEQAGWTIFFARISEAGMKPMFGGGEPQSWNDVTARVTVDVYPVSDDLKQSEAARKLCEFVKAQYVCFPEMQQGGWMSYADRHVAIFLPAREYPPESAAEKIMAETDNCLVFVNPLREAQAQIADMVAQNPEWGRKPEPVMSWEEVEAAVQQMLADWIEKNGDTLDPNLERLTETDIERYQNLKNTRHYHPIDFMKDCKDNPDNLRVLAQYDLIALTKRLGSP